MNRKVFVVKIIKEEINHFKNLKASFDEAAMEKVAKDLNDKGFKGIRYEVETVRFMEEEINEDDF